MDIISAIDINQGKVVKAFAGFRINYKPLIINKKDYSNPINFIKFLTEKLFYKKVYIADLDSIKGKNDNWWILLEILSRFQKVNFILDLGFNSIIKISEFEKFVESHAKNLLNWRPIIGTETLKKNHKLLPNFSKKKVIFSIDFNGEEKFWIKKIKKKHDFEIILLFIKKVGGRGINWKELKKLRAVIQSRKSIIAGGIRHNGEIMILKQMGYKGVIISTLIHKKIELEGELNSPS